MSLFVLTSLLSLGLIPTAFAAEVAAPALVDAELGLDRVPLDDVPDVDAASEGLSGDAAVAAAAEVPGLRSATVTAPIAFTGLWAELPDGLDAINVRTSVDGEDWSAWSPLEVQDGLDGPDPGSAEAEAAIDLAETRLTELHATVEGRYIQVEAPGDGLTEVTLSFVDADGLNEGVVAKLVRHLTPRPVPALAATVPPDVNTRAAWGAQPYRGTPDVAKYGVEQIVVHHTATPNDMRRADGTCNRDRITARMRSMQHYHQVANGWSDLGYNVVIDPCGGIWEGREGGLDRAVIGAHAAGANANSTGVAVIGNYYDLTPNPQILAALDRVVGWKAGIHGIDTTGTVTRTIKGTTKSYPTVVGHRQVGSTACPGRIMNFLDRVRVEGKAQAGSWDRVADGAAAVSFSDTRGSTHEGAIEELVARGITDGYPDRTFKPHRAINRAQVASFMAKTLDLEPIPGARFEDVDANYVHAGAINALVEAGIIGGYPNGTFRPTEPLRREHMAAIITRALELDLDPEHAAVFSDVVGYAGEIGAIAAAGITTGKGDGTFQPEAAVTRGQMATFLMNAIRILEPEPEPEPDPEPGPDPEPEPSPDPSPGPSPDPSPGPGTP